MNIQDITDDDLSALLEFCRYAASGGNRILLASICSVSSRRKCYAGITQRKIKAARTLTGTRIFTGAEVRRLKQERAEKLAARAIKPKWAALGA